MSGVIVGVIIGIIVGIIVRLAVSAISRASTWIFERRFRPEIHIDSAIEQRPANRELGFTEPVVKITLTNKSWTEVRIRDIRLMFCGVFGASITPEAPRGRSHLELPASLPSGEVGHWYIPAEQLSDLLRSLYRPPDAPASEFHDLKLYARCITGTGKVYRGSSFAFSTDSNAHWRNPLR